MVGLNFKFEVVACEVGGQLLNQVLTDGELLVKLVDLLDSLLVDGVCSCDLTELRGKVTQNEGEDGHTNNDDEHSPDELIFVCGEDITVADCCTGNSGPIERCHELVEVRGILKAILGDPIDIRLKVELRSSLPEASSDHKDENKLYEGSDNALNTNWDIQIFEELREVWHSKSHSSELEDQHDLVETRHSLEVLVEEVLDFVVATFFILGNISHVCQRIERVEIRDEHGGVKAVVAVSGTLERQSVILEDLASLADLLAMLVIKWRREDPEHVDQIDETEHKLRIDDELTGFGLETDSIDHGE